MTTDTTATVAVTGGAGLIGSHLVDLLLEQGARVVVIDDFSKGTRDNLQQSLNSIELREGNLEDPGFTHEALAGCDTVYHLASRAYGVGYGQGHHMEILAHNERITTNVIDALDAHRPKRVLITSSSCVYDDNGPDTIPELPLFLDAPEKVNKGYGWAKRFLEQKSVLLAEETGIPITIVRPFNIYGERYRWVGKYSQAIPMLVRRILNGEDPVLVWGSGNQRRSYIHAHDCARMMIGLTETNFTTSPVNIGTEETISVRDLVSLICQTAELSPELTFDLSKPEGRSIKSSNTALFQSVLPGFEFDVSLKDGVQRMLGWYEKTFPNGAEPEDASS